MGLTGASGSPYFLELMNQLAGYEIMVHVIASDNGKKVFEYETKLDFLNEAERWKKDNPNIIIEDNQNLFSSVASGSYACDGMIILPCSMSALGQIHSGITNNLLTRAADVCIKEQRRLVLVPRETPFSAIHLRNMYELSKLNVTIMPAMPGFYNHPETLSDVISFIVGKSLDALQIENTNYKRWEGLK